MEIAVLNLKGRISVFTTKYITATKEGRMNHVSSRLNKDPNIHDLCDTGAALYQLS